MRLRFRATLAAVLAALGLCGPAPPGGGAAPASIDRRALVARHDVVLDRVDARNPLQVGNGEFAFACDATGLQTLDANLGTYAQWGWHTFPNPQGFRYEETLEEVQSGERRAKYATRVRIHGEPTERVTAGDWYRRSPHRLHLGRIGFELRDDAGRLQSGWSPTAVRQRLDLWRGRVESAFTCAGQPVEVVTCVHPKLDLVAVRVRSPLVRSRRLGVFWHFPYSIFRARPGAGPDCGPSWDPADEAKHRTEVERRGPGRVDLDRRLGADRYRVAIAWSDPGELERTGPHRFRILPSGRSDELAFVSAFGAETPGQLPGFAESDRAAARHWADFWNSGGAVDLSGSRDPRWRELERRIVISEYLTRIQTCGSSPPQESGLFANSWYGKFHLEMTAWHGVHYVLWGREHLIDGWLRWFEEIGLPAARRQARAQGYAGARWPKMIDRYASWESPSPIGPFRLTQQGHAIFWMELVYRLRPTRATLERYRDLVFETAEFMVDFVAWDPASGRYRLGPPLYSGSEATSPPTAAFNSTVELSYWFYGLRTAQLWRERLGLARDAEWDRVLANLARPAVREGKYLDAESHPGLWAGRPAWFEAYGCMPGVEIDPRIMARNLDAIVGDLPRWGKNIYGCDFPMLAMTAARLGRRRQAIELLLHPGERNDYLANGFNVGGSTPFLPASGGLLWAVAMMAGGWEGGPRTPAPGFPDDGSWVVRAEGLRPAP